MTCPYCTAKDAIRDARHARKRFVSQSTLTVTVDPCAPLCRIHEIHETYPDDERRVAGGEHPSPHDETWVAAENKRTRNE